MASERPTTEQVRACLAKVAASVVLPLDQGIVAILLREADRRVEAHERLVSALRDASAEMWRRHKPMCNYVGWNCDCGAAEKAAEWDTLLAEVDAEDDDG